VAEADHALSTGRGGFAVGSLLYNGAAFTMTWSLVLPDVTEFRHDNPFDNPTSIGRRSSSGGLPMRRSRATFKTTQPA
jgi:hypothetical protein